MVEKIVSLKPALMPLSGIKIDPPLPVECIQNSSPLKKGDRCYVIAVYSTGRVLTGTSASFGVETSGLHEMDRFRELITELTPVNDNAKGK